MTAAMRHGSLASSSACRLLPRPEMRMTMDFIGRLLRCPSCDLRLMFGAVARADRADHGCALAGCVELCDRRIRIAPVHDDHHADAAIECAVHFLWRDVA